MDTLRKPVAPVVVDCHVHLFPERLFAAIRRWFARANWEIPYPYRLPEVLSLLGGWGVEEVWALTYAHRRGVADDVNRWMGEVVRQQVESAPADSFPDPSSLPIVRGFFSVHPDDDEPEEIARRALDEYDLCGLKLHAEVQQLSVSDPRLDRMFDLLQERKVPCVLHSGDAPYPEWQPHLDVSRVAERLHRNPGLVAVIAHLGANQTRAYCALTEEYEHLYLEVSFTRFPGSAASRTIDFQDLARHRSRLLFGSDFPNLTFTYADQADAWWELDWVRADSEAFLGGRARQLLPSAPDFLRRARPKRS